MTLKNIEYQTTLSFEAQKFRFEIIMNAEHFGLLDKKASFYILTYPSSLVQVVLKNV